MIMPMKFQVLSFFRDVSQKFQIRIINISVKIYCLIATSVIIMKCDLLTITSFWELSPRRWGGQWLQFHVSTNLTCLLLWAVTSRTLHRDEDIHLGNHRVERHLERYVVLSISCVNDLPPSLFCGLITYVRIQGAPNPDFEFLLSSWAFKCSSQAKKTADVKNKQVLAFI